MAIGIRSVGRKQYNNITVEIRDFKYGTINNIEPNSIPPGAIADSLNFITQGDHMELRRGSRVKGTTQGAGSMGGIGVATKLDATGTQVLFRKRNGTQKFEYYDETTADWLETGTNATPLASINDDFEFDLYSSQTGAQAFWSSPLSSIYKILVANPGSITDLISTVYRGYIRIKQSRMFLWNKNSASGGGAHDEQNIYTSYIDAQAYTTVTGESIASLAGTLAFKAGGSKRTCFGVVITLTGTGEVFTDNRDGTLTGSLANTGTINYTTGDYTISIAGAGTADYQWENTASTGIADFSYSGTRTAGQGNIYLQGAGGPIMGVESYGDVEYCAHKFKTYSLQLTKDDTGANNLMFRDKEGIPNHRAIKATSLGIFYVNAVDPGQPRIKVLTLQPGSTAVDGVVISHNIDLSPYLFDKCFVIEFEDWVIFSCRTSDSIYNNRFVMYNKVWKAFDIVDYWALCASIYNGSLVAGGSLFQDVSTLFSGVDDDDAVIDGYAQLNNWDFGSPGMLKKCKSLEIEGNIGPDQIFDVMVSGDDGAFVTVGQIDGKGSYVDRTQAVNVGADTVGRHPVAGLAGSGDGIVAYHYFRSISLRFDKFERISVKFVRGIRTTTAADGSVTNQDGIGYFSFSTVRFRDIRFKNSRIARKYRN